MTEPRAPSAAAATVRDRLEEELRREPATAFELSQRVGIPEKDVPEHLQHLERSLRAKGERLQMDPAACLQCGFVFKHRDRLTKPGRCPECESTRIEAPVFSIPAQ